MGAILYKYNFTKHQAPKVSDVNYRLPYEEHGLRAGFYIECAAGGLFFVTSLLYIVDTVYANGYGICQTKRRVFQFSKANSQWLAFEYLDNNPQKKS